MSKMIAGLGALVLGLSYVPAALAQQTVGPPRYGAWVAHPCHPIGWRGGWVAHPRLAV
ncbi:MAG TPA: hypothetical protein VEK07_05555 [Polyangiaceae bacterium]|nr:hypothetical protein [Polyangiaceae bacterium]